jgi:hypothetical protein
LILLVAVFAGLFAGWLRARLDGRMLLSLNLRCIPLAFLAYLPQFLAFGFPLTRRSFPGSLAAAALVSSQVLLLGFAWANQRRPGFWLLGFGLLLNLIVIAANGGLMPISPETVSRLAEGAPAAHWAVGERLGFGKDIVLPSAEICLPFLADRFLFPAWMRLRVAFSFGDVLIALGAFRLLFSLGGRESGEQKGV